MRAEAVAARLSREEAIARAKALAAQISPYVSQAEEERRMPAPVVDALMRSGLMPLVRPARYGGFEHDWLTFTDVLMELNESGSMAWCLGFLVQHQWVLSHYPQSVQDHVYGKHPDPKIVSSFAPLGRVQKVEGGYRVSGRWPFGSGGDHCDWAMVGGMVFADGAPPSMRTFLCKPGQFAMADTWFSIGLKGSGSNDIVVEDQFVEEAFALDFMAAMHGHAPGAQFLSGPLYQAGLGVQFQFGLVAPLYVTARAALKSAANHQRERVLLVGVGKAADNPFVQARLGEAAGELDAAYALISLLNDKLMRGLMQGPDSEAEFLRGIGAIVRLCLAATDRVFNAAGARGLNEANPIGRHWRDVHAMSNHATLVPEPLFQTAGRALLGLPPLRPGG